MISVEVNLSSQKLSVDNSGFFYQIAPLFEFRKSAVSLTFDDGSKNQFEIGLPMLKEHNLPATFYLITNSIDTATSRFLVKNSSAEFELGSHTASHPDLIKIGKAEARNELRNSQLFLKENFGINSGLTMSYPWGIHNKAIKLLTAEYYMAARSTYPGYNSFTSLDRYSLSIQGFDANSDANRANLWVNFAIKNNLWLIEMIHGINNIGYSPIDSAVLSEHLDYIVNAGDKIWCGTVSDVIKYLDESRNAIVSCDFYTDSVFTIRAEDYLDDMIYDYPLTLRVKVPSNWEKISISDVEKFRVEITNKSKFVIFNTLPDNSEHTLRPTKLSVPEKESGIKIIYLSANPFSDIIKLSLEIFETIDLDISLFDMSGKEMAHSTRKNVTGVLNLYFETSSLSRGMYFLSIKSSYGEILVKKLLKV
jgi:peptidoglycan/xylan/chitin deacetylase (PgdA/CDA1 family)